MATKSDSVIEITIEGRKNENLFFSPLGRMVRGTFDLDKDDWPRATELRTRYGDRRIPGQVLGIDIGGRDGGELPRAWIRDLAAEHGPTRDKIEKLGFSLPPAREDITIAASDVATWLYWMRRAVESDLAAVTKGALPQLADIKGEIRKSFFSEPPQKSTGDRMTEAIERQNELMTRLLEKLAK